MVALERESLAASIPGSSVFIIHPLVIMHLSSFRGKALFSKTELMPDTLMAISCGAFTFCLSCPTCHSELPISLGLYHPWQFAIFHTG